MGEHQKLVFIPGNPVEMLCFHQCMEHFSRVKQFLSKEPRHPRFVMQSDDSLNSAETIQSDSGARNRIPAWPSPSVSTTGDGVVGEIRMQFPSLDVLRANCQMFRFCDQPPTTAHEQGLFNVIIQ